MNSHEPIAIIGIGCRFPGNGNTPSALWNVLRDPPDLLTTVPEDRFNIDGFYHENGQLGGHTNVRSSYFLEGKDFHKKFDAQFFGISPMEAHAIDPQVRILLETVYEAVEDSGHTMDGIQGSDTAVYSGVLMHDYEHIMSRDAQFMNKYHATGVTPSLIANRISYFFDWHGPSMILDTACSASLYAVHLAMQQLRSGGSSLAVATGCNLMLDPLAYISQSKMNMLSPTGRSRMWDADADGYARGEGIAALILKPLSRAEADGDPIHAVIREAGVNQDGKTPGITMPSSKAQIALIRDCYARAGLDITRQADRPQFFEAHGTGTPAGDPIEAEAIEKTFFSNKEAENFGPLYVGGIKTVIGHTEGTAGLAGLIKVVLAMKHATIPANLLFNRINPRVAPFYTNLRIPTSALEWPPVGDNQPRRASVNSFGFGGANAHAILESYIPKLHQTPEIVVFSPFIFSAVSEASLTAYLDTFREFLAAQGNKLNMRDLAFTLHSRRTRFLFTASFPASSPDLLLCKITERMETVRSRTNDGLGVRAAQISRGGPRILGVFTGQGAQWARMGAELISSSPTAKKIIDRLDDQLASLPEEVRPLWTIAGELVKDAASSNNSDPTLAQPLSLAVQIILIDILEVAGVRFSAVVGHSSGEIAAAYAAKRISAEDAICLSYYRGLSVASSKPHDGKSGAMLVVGTSQQDVEELLAEPEFKNRAWIASINSSASITISGDSDAINEIHAVLQDEKKFTRLLKVNRAYHSPHMLSYSSDYKTYQKNMSIVVNPASRSVWFSSVSGEDNSTLQDELKGSYWVDNLLSPVYFKQAVERAWSDIGPFDIVVEIGPHPALKGPVQQIFQDIADRRVPYTGLLQRGISDLESLANGMGYIYSHAGKGSVDLKAYETFLSDNATFHTLQGLPPYSWNHSTDYWHESRYTWAVSHRSDKVHELLGHLTPDSSDREMRWRHSICPKEVPWLSGHRIQGQTVFPGAVFIVTVVEACLKLKKEQPVSLIEVLDIVMGQALTFDDDDTPVEVVLTLADIQKQKESPFITGRFNFSASKGKGVAILDSLAYGKFRIVLGVASSTALPGGSSQSPGLLDIGSDDFYASLRKLDYEFSGPFIALSGLRRKLGLSTGFLPELNEPSLLIHPAMLDALFQSIVLAASAPHDGRIWVAHVPSHIKAVRVNPSLCDAQRGSKVRPAFEASCEQSSDMSYVLGNSNLFPEGYDYSMVAVEGANLVALSRATADNDRVMFSSHCWGPASPDISQIDVIDRSIPRQHEFIKTLQRAAYFYLRKLEQDVPHDHSCRFDGPYTAIFHYASHTLHSFMGGLLSLWCPEWETDSHETIESLFACGPSTPDSELLRVMGPRLADIVTGNASPIDIGMQNNLLAKYYEGSIGVPESLDRLAQTVGQILHRHPHIRCLEIGAGTGTATKAILRENEFLFSEYTFTDISPGFFVSAQASLGKHADGMVFKALDISKDICSQGFEPHFYELVIASLVLHATPCLIETLKNVRRLLKPGGYLVAIEMQKDIPSHVGTIFGAFSGWWLGANDGRLLSPCVDISQWNDLLCQTGFSGCDSSAFEPDPFVHPASIFVSQAVDERIEFLRNPLSTPPASDITISRLVLLGGESSETGSLVAPLLHLLQPYCANIVHCQQLTETQTLGIGSDTLVLSLVDLYRPLFQQLTEATWESLKSLLQCVGSLIWVTRDRRVEKPHSNMMVGFMRSVLNEIPNIATQFLDFEDERQLDAEVLSSAVLRFAKAVKLKQEDNFADMLHTIEPELSFQKTGMVAIPRLKRERAMNDRYNASRRAVSTTIRTAQASISLGPAKPGYYVRQNRGSIIESTKTSPDPIVRVSHSLLMPLRVNRHSSLFWSLGILVDTRTPVIALSLLNEEVVHPEICIPVPADCLPDNIKPCFLRQVVLFQISSLILGDLEDGDRVLIHDAEPALAKFIQSEGQKRGIEVVCTATHDRVSNEPLKLHSNASDRSLKALRPDSMVVFGDFGVTWESSRVSQRLLRHLNVACRRETVQSIFGGLKRSLARITKEKFQKVLRDALASIACGLRAAPETDAGNVIGLAYIDTIKDHLAYRYIVDWTIGNKVGALVEPVDTHSLFSPEKTYWLVGLTGSLGLSLCEWMIRKGARHIALSSRNPKVESCWLEMIASWGSVVKVATCDIVNMQELQTAYEDISSNMPPIAGVAQGAMVLHDIGLAAMSIDHLQKVTRPKVEGSINLDKLFQDKELDFFIYFSSVTSVVGTPGQASYSAANLFMTSLAEQQRQRGLSSAVINIGPVVGAGYVMRTTPNIKPIILLGLRPLSELDFHLLVAEAVVACQSKLSRPINITMGINQIHGTEEIQPKWAANPIMSHWIRKDRKVDVAANKSTTSLKEQLLAARNEDQVYNLMRGAILERLIALLRLDFDINSFDDTMGLNDLGVDSLMATEVRLLLMNSFQINVPVLRIMSGISLKDLVTIVVDALDPSMTPNARMKPANGLMN
ncbi:hypothetical protein QQS21_008200 [Conoideocrella luteorostrata]|uniref:Polyketide synthase n=1 Tax=Conoideocrella luteorostrata TaxID=1105319 RepID=A0AAJ0CM32_9HYPO|nr:hypothetical protein QQS21_008200 [Conoideocrella luteorostrata]